MADNDASDQGDVARLQGDPGLLRRAREYLRSWGSYQMGQQHPDNAVSRYLAAHPEYLDNAGPAMTYLSLIGPKGAKNLAAHGDLRAMRALEYAKKTNAEMMAKGASLDDINRAISAGAKPITSEGTPFGPDEALPMPQPIRTPTGKISRAKKYKGVDETPTEKPSPYGDTFRMPSHEDNPPRYMYGDEKAAYLAKQAQREPDFLVETADNDRFTWPNGQKTPYGSQDYSSMDFGRGLTVNYGALRRPWYAPWRNPRGTQTGLEGPIFSQPQLAKAYPEAKDWTFKIESNPEGVSGYTSRPSKEVYAAGPETAEGYYYPSERGDAGSGTRTARDVLAHELGTHFVLGEEGHDVTGGNPATFYYGRNKRAYTDPLDKALGTAEGISEMEYNRLAPEWLARKVGDRAGANASMLRESPIMNPDKVGFTDLPPEIPSSFKRKKGESDDAYQFRYELQSPPESASTKAQRSRYPGEMGWTEPVTNSELFWNYTLPTWGKRIAKGTGVGAAGYGINKWLAGVGKSKEDEAKAWADRPMIQPPIPPLPGDDMDEYLRGRSAAASDDISGGRNWGWGHTAIGALSAINTVTPPYGLWKTGPSLAATLWNAKEARNEFNRSREGASRKPELEAARRGFADLGLPSRRNPDDADDETKWPLP